MTDCPNVEKLARLFDWALGVVFSLVTLLLWLLVMLFIVVLII